MDGPILCLTQTNIGSIEMSHFKIHDTTYQAVVSALDVIDSRYGEVTRKSEGPCGDELASKLHKVIQEALTKLEEQVSGQ